MEFLQVTAVYLDHEVCILCLQLVRERNLLCHECVQLGFVRVISEHLLHDLGEWGDIAEGFGVTLQER